MPFPLEMRGYHPIIFKKCGKIRIVENKKSTNLMGMIIIHISTYNLPLVSTMTLVTLYLKSCRFLKYFEYYK